MGHVAVYKNRKLGHIQYIISLYPHASQQTRGPGFRYQSLHLRPRLFHSQAFPAVLSTPELKETRDHRSQMTPLSQT